uniref:ZP domain-containing protein n=1 Tax=Tetranychus urticae TaxID=32264 RepID=T1L3T9_TETUR
MVNHLLSIFILTQVINLSYVASLAPQIKDLKVQCDSDGMEVNVTFDSPFNGIIFSKGYYNDMGCRYVQEKSDSSNLAFKIPAEGCGTASVLSKDVKDSKQFENVIIFQNDPIYQEVWDSARLLSCRYSLQRDLPVQEKRVIFKPFLVDMLDVIRVPMADFAGDEHKVDCWMDVTKGRYPNNSPIDGPVKVGENLTLAIYIRDTRKRTDIRVKDCYAYDNEKSVNDTSPALLQLSGEDGCPLKPKLMDVWKRTTTGAQDATVLAYSTVTAFKFPDHSNVHLTCNVELCKNQCADRCSLEEKEIAKGKNGEASTDGDEEMSKSSESESDDEDDDDDSNSNKNDESDVKPVSISTKAAPASAPKRDSTKSEDAEDEDSNAGEEAKMETTSAKPTTASSVKDADEDEDAASEDAAEGSTSERGGRKSDGEDNEEGTDEETSVGSSTSTSTTTSTTTAKPSEDEDEEEDKSDEEDEDKKSETSPTTTTSTTSTTSTTTTTTTTTEKPSEKSEDDEEDEDGVDDSDTDSRKRSLRPAKAEGKSIADDEDEDEEDNSSKLISFKAKQSMKTKAEASEDEDYDDDLQSSRGSSTSVSPVTTTTTPIPKTPLIIVIKPEKSRKKIKEAARRGRIESRSRQAVRSSSSKLGSSRSISSQVSRESCCSDVTTTSSRSDRKSTTSTTKSPIIARSSSGRSVRRSSRFDEPNSENKQAKTSTTTTTTSTTVAPKKIKTTSTKRPRRRSTTTTTTTTTTPRTTTESDEDKEETEAPRTFRKSTRKPKRPVVRTRKSLTDRLFIPHSNDRQTTPKTVTTTISPSISSSSTFRIASNRFSTHRSNPYLRSTLKPATIPSSRNSLRLTSSSTVAPPKRLADFDEFKDNEALIENEKPDRNRIKPSSSSAATGASRRWDGDELFNPFKEIEYEPVRLNNNRNQRRRRSLYTLSNDQHTDEKLSNYNMPIIF